MKKILIILSLLTTFLFSRSDAFIVGVGEYQNDIASLWGVEKDITNIEKLFRYLSIDNIQTIKDEQATLQNIRNLFNNYINSPKNNPNNSFIFYYSGHGVQVNDIDGDEADGKDEGTALYDLALKPNQDIITGGLLLDDELYTILGKIKSKKILILDKCHSDSSHRGRVVKSLPPEDYNITNEFWQDIQKITFNAENILTNFVLFSASQAEEEAEDSPFGGLFTNSIIDGILYKKADLNHNGIITVEELQKFCRYDVSRLATHINKSTGDGLKGDFAPQFRPTEILNDSIESIFNTKIEIPQTQPRVVKAEKVASRSYLLEDTLDNLTTNRLLQLNLLFNKHSYRENERIRFKLKSSKKGYLSIFIAYKNSYKLFMKNQKINALETYRFPHDFYWQKHLIAKKPYGTTKIYTILSRKPLDIERYLSNSSLDKGIEDLSLTNQFRKGVMVSYGSGGKVLKKADILEIGKVELEVFRR